ncbi:hypothetical protein WP12_12165 [Sphingomonas sp. SRS2]|nr:hypothetical protein WP12_12165 [Sphingomonas sp. SRS2]
MVATIVTQAPAVEIDDGLLHLTWPNGEHAYWKPKALQGLFTQAQPKLDALELASHRPPTLRRIK